MSRTYLGYVLLGVGRRASDIDAVEADGPEEEVPHRLSINLARFT